MDQIQWQNSFRAYFKKQGYDICWDGLTLPMDVHCLSKGDYLFQQGDFANQLYFLHTGLVRYVSVSAQGKEFTQSFVKGARIIGSTKAMVTQTPSMFGIQALGDCLLLSYPWKAFYGQMRHDKAFLEFYIHFLEGLFIDKDERARALVKYSAERRYLDFCTDFAELKDSIPQQHIASYIGITPVALSRIRKKLKLGASD
ncbi:Crp/Fnr family transcriptional regulator [Marinomonas transparens]|uniref:Crp/Fnr family transcriptional regulator n=1 Tax=Marinomonas transparens TaxID=2795388 RepID=A0A934N3V9_9GAMM|nr:Crp/Fnr family transcriptional regulator [Marinomonas transparens]MBJ7539423.1 Crp/Fnr family transcriptional regulator [Marinomonas transparens]